MVLPITPINLPGYPTTQITPFTYRDGLTYLAKLELIARHIDDKVVPYIKESYAELSEATEVEVSRLITEFEQILVDGVTFGEDLSDPGFFNFVKE